jgi:inorganic triphosphatase YgiF
MSHAGREIELKFHCAPQDLPAVLAAAPAGDDEVRELISVYFDTPDRALERAGVSLRVRESGGRRIQTLKRGKGLSREEHERPVEGFRPETEAAPLSEILPPDEAAELKPAFYVGVHRRQRLVRHGGAEIEIALDHGEVRAGGGKSPICEVELELKSGPASALFGLARELIQAAPLYLAFDGKASVGQALTAGSKPQARRKDDLALKKDASAAEAFMAVARNALAHIAGAAQVLREAPQPQAIHQLRVAARRLRTALATFAPVVRDGRRDWVKGELRWLAQACNDARDLDVFAEAARGACDTLEAPSPGLPELMARLDGARDHAAAEARVTAGSERFRELLLEVTAWAEVGPWTSDPARAALRAVPARAFAAERLARQLKHLKHAARHFDHADAEHRHKVRIEAKKLRYAAEAFASLFHAKAVQPYVDALKALQDELGALNDAAVGERLIAGLSLDRQSAFAAGRLAGLRAAEIPRRRSQARKALHRLKQLEPFWFT